MVMVHFWRPLLPEDSRKTLMPLAKGKQTDSVASTSFPDHKTHFPPLLPEEADSTYCLLSQKQIAISWGKGAGSLLYVSTAPCEIVMGSPGISEVPIMNLTDSAMEGLSISSELFTYPLSGSHHSTASCCQGFSR